MHPTDFFGRTLCRTKYPARFFEGKEHHACSINMRSYPDKWDGEKQVYVPLCRIPNEYSLIKDGDSLLYEDRLTRDIKQLEKAIKTMNEEKDILEAELVDYQSYET